MRMPEFVRALTPQIVDSWGKFIVKVGAWAVLAFYLASALVGDVRSSATESLRLLQSHVGATESLTRQQDTIIDLLRLQTNVMTQNCVNTAEDRVDRDRCFAALNGGDPKQ